MKGKILRNEKPYRSVWDEPQAHVPYPYQPPPITHEEPQWIKCPRCWEMHRVEGRTDNGIWWWCGTEINVQQEG